MENITLKALFIISLTLSILFSLYFSDRLGSKEFIKNDAIIMKTSIIFNGKLYNAILLLAICSDSIKLINIISIFV
jgi:hypothetical protein